MDSPTEATTTSIDSSASQTKKVASLRKMVKGARKAMERRPEKAPKSSRNSGKRLPKTTNSSIECAPPDEKPKTKRSVKMTKAATETVISSTNDISTSRRKDSTTSQEPKSPKKLQQHLSATYDQYISPKKLGEKLPYAVRDLPQYGSPSKSTSKYDSPKKKLGSPLKLGNLRKLDSPQKLYAVSCVPPYVGDDDDDDDERSLGSFGLGVPVLESLTSLDSSWATLDPSENSTSSHANTFLFPPTTLNMSGHRQQLTDQASDSSFTSWGNMSIGTDKDDLAYRSLTLVTNL
eukprot:scaffold4059_cov177-Amphora_coffeaeformis.AAC.16